MCGSHELETPAATARSFGYSQTGQLNDRLQPLIGPATEAEEDFFLPDEVRSGPVKNQSKQSRRIRKGKWRMGRETARAAALRRRLISCDAPRFSPACAGCAWPRLAAPPG